MPNCQIAIALRIRSVLMLSKKCGYGSLSKLILLVSKANIFGESQGWREITARQHVGPETYVKEEVHVGAATVVLV